MSNGEKNETKLCKYCQTSIPNKAKICPNCRKRQNSVLKWVIIWIAIFAIIGAATGQKQDNIPSKKTEEDENKVTFPTKSQEKTEELKTEDFSEEKKEIFMAGDTAELKGIKMSLNDYKESEGGIFNKPNVGNVFMLAEFEIENNTEKDLNISSMLNFKAYADDYSLNYSLSAMIENDESQLDGVIASGKKMKGWIGWEVPKEYKEIEIHFAKDFLGSNKLIFLIEK